MNYTVSEIIKIFHEKHYKLYCAMNDIKHGYTDIELNPWHLEGSIWTHTMMVMKEAERKYNNNIMLFSALCHDFGKCFTVEDNSETKRRSFKNHEAVSTFYAKEVLESFELFPFEKEQILEVVAQHGSLYNFIEDGRISVKYWDKIAGRYTLKTFNNLSAFYDCDHNGRFSTTKTDLNNSDSILTDFLNIFAMISNKIQTRVLPDKKLTMLIGLPRNGKSTWVSENVKNETVISRDVLVVQYGKGATYSGKWKSLTSEQQEMIDKELMKDFNQALNNGDDIIIDMTNMSKKSRKKWLNNPKTKSYFKEAKLFIVPNSTLLQRMTDDKNIPEYVIDNMMKSFTYPDLEEFDKVELIQ